MRLLIEAANACVAIEARRIIDPSGTFDLVIRTQGELRPGLINAHDHLHRNHYSRLGAPPYANAAAWASDIQVRCAAEIARGRSVPRRQALLAGAWKNLLAGVTHVVHHDPWEPDFDDDFPITVVRVENADSIANCPDFAPSPTAPFAMHVAEGVDESAAKQIPALAARGLLNNHLLAVHVVGADATGVVSLRESGCAIVWCPTSNDFLFGRSAPLELLADGTDVLFGSDSLLTGAGTLLDELHAARGIISDARLESAVGEVAARRLRIAAPSLSPGALASLVLLRRPLLDATLDDVSLVLVEGEVRVAHPDLVPVLELTCGQMITWRGVTRWISETAAFVI